MSIWGRSDSEPAAEEAHESQAPAQEQQAQAPDQPDHQVEPEQQAEEPAPAFWRAQGETLASIVRDPADARRPLAAEGEEPAMAEAQELGGAEPQEPGANGTEQPTAAGAEQPAVTSAAPPAVKPHGAAAPASSGGISAQRWSEIMVAFVDDPRGSVKMAADAVDEAIDEFVNSVRARQRDLTSAWHGDESGTEELRTALREYRKLWHQVQQLDLSEKIGA